MEDYIYQLSEYLPIDFGNDENNYFKDNYILSYKDNLAHYNLQLAYLSFHILFMTAIYKQFWFHKQYDYETVRSLCEQNNTYKISENMFEISQDSEKDAITNILSKLGFDPNQRRQVANLVTIRDQCAHAYGKIYFREIDDIEHYFKTALKNINKIQVKSKEKLIHEFYSYLYTIWGNNESFKYKNSSELAKELIIKFQLSANECEFIIDSFKIDLLNNYKDNGYASKYLSLLMILFYFKSQVIKITTLYDENMEDIDSWQLSLLGEFVEKINIMSSEEMKLFQVEYEDELNRSFELETLSSSVLNKAFSMFNVKFDIKIELETKYSFYISYAHDDGATVAQSLYEELITYNLGVWFDKNEILTGDNIRKTIDKGLSESKYGIVILTESYFKKAWTNYELDALTQRQMVEDKIILPIWHNITKEEVMKYSPALASLMALKTSDNTIQEIALILAKTIKN